jgi:TRAP-type mannitol/chloroaromatic compound transport system permease small subunit
MRAASASRMCDLPAGISSAGRGPRWLNAVADRIDSVTTAIGRVVAWLTLATVLICFATVYLRYALHIGLIWLQELYAWTHVAAITMGAGYVLLKGGFVRVDMVYARLSDRGKAWVNLLGTLFLMAPFLYMMAAAGWPFFKTSWMMNEASQQDTGLPRLWLLKGTLLAFVFVVGLQGVSMVARSLATILSPAGDDTEAQGATGGA